MTAFFALIIAFLVLFVRAYSLKRTVIQGGAVKDDVEKREAPAVAGALAKEEDDDEKKSIREISRVHSNKTEAVDDAATEHTHTG